MSRERAAVCVQWRFGGRLSKTQSEIVTGGTACASLPFHTLVLSLALSLSLTSTGQLFSLTMALVELFFLLTIIGALLYKWSVSGFGYFTRRGVAHLPPQPLVGNIPWSVLMGSGSYLRHSIELHQQLKQHKIYGVYNMRDPLYYLADPELIRQVGIKHFDVFSNHRQGIADDSATGDSSVMSKSLLTLRDRRWQQMRSTLTPAFTGAKIRLMFELIHACNVEAVRYVERKLAEHNNEGVELELKEFFTRYTNDVIATAAFGIQVNSFVDEQNEFFMLGQRISQFSLWGGIKVMLYILLPRLMKVSKWRCGCRQV